MTETTEKNPTDDYMQMIDRPHVEGETIDRRVRSYYLSIKDDLRAGPVDFGTIAALQDLLRPFVRTNELVNMADRHLIDAANESLPLDVREEHFDIAGSLVWQFGEGRFHSVPEVAAFINTWRNANGV